jgi:catechol 2,3-dioxygenase-like lactoylglutathione lyase family enzyme
MPEIKGTDVTIMVKDLDKSISFYEKIGLKLQNRWGEHYARVVTTGITIGLHPGRKDESSSPHISIGFMIADINEAKNLLDTNHVAYKAEEGKSGKFTHFKDPDGTVLYFMQEMY